MYRLTRTKTNGLSIIVDSHGVVNDDRFILRKVKRYNEDASTFCYGFNHKEIDYMIARDPEVTKVFICDLTSIQGVLGRVYKTTKKFKEKYNTTGNQFLYIPNKFLLESDAMELVSEYIHIDNFDLYFKNSLYVFTHYILINDYVKSKYGYIGNEKINLLHNDLMLTSRDKEQVELAKILVFTSGYSSFEKQILLNHIPVMKISLKDYNSLCPEIKNYVKNKAIKKIAHAYRNVIERYDIQLT